MRRVVFDAHGTPSEMVRVEELDDPVPGPDQIRVRLKVMPINPADIARIKGRYGEAVEKLPATPGAEAYGVIDALGEGVDGVAVGQGVIPMGGACWADTRIVSARAFIPVPNGVDPEQAAMLKANPATAEAMLTTIARLRRGDWVLQTAANSAVGRLIIQFAKFHGLHTINIVRREEQRAPLMALGADIVIVDDGSGTIGRQLGTLAVKPRLALDAVGGALTGVLAGAMLKGGTVAVFGTLSGEAAQVGLSDLVFRDVSVRGFWLSSWFQEATPDQIRSMYDTLMERLVAGAFCTEIEARYPIERVADAVAHAEQPGRLGKVLLTA